VEIDVGGEVIDGVLGGVLDFGFEAGMAAVVRSPTNGYFAGRADHKRRDIT
jgi:hypothetical protein